MGCPFRQIVSPKRPVPIYTVSEADMGKNLKLSRSCQHDRGNTETTAIFFHQSRSILASTPCADHALVGAAEKLVPCYLISPFGGRRYYYNPRFG